MESLPHDVVELILGRAPVKSLLRFKAVSKNWKSTIESRLFQERQLKHRQQSEGPDVLMVSVLRYEDDCSDPDLDTLEIESLRTLELGSSSSVKIPTPWENTYHFVCPHSCDGLVCLFFPDHSGFVVNPTTRWHRVLPLTNYQQRLIIYTREERSVDRYFGLGFGKDKFTNTFKPVWLYNSSEIGLKDGTTTCEVFDFSTDAWRYVTPSAPYEVTGHYPAYLDGSLYYFTNCLETKILSFDLHTEAFQVVAKAPFSCVSTDKYKMVIGNLDNRIYVSNNLKWSNQDIWLFNSGNKTWDKMYSIDMDKTLMKLGIKFRLPVAPIALLDGEKKKKKKLLFVVVVYIVVKHWRYMFPKPNHMMLLSLLTPLDILFVISIV